MRSSGRTSPVPNRKFRRTKSPETDSEIGHETPGAGISARRTMDSAA